MFTKAGIKLSNRDEIRGCQAVVKDERGGERLSVSSYTSKLHQASHTCHIRLVYACVKNKAQIRPARLTPAAIFRPLWPAKVRPGIGVQFEAMVKMLELGLAVSKR